MSPSILYPRYTVPARRSSDLNLSHPRPSSSRQKLMSTASIIPHNPHSRSTSQLPTTFDNNIFKSCIIRVPKNTCFKKFPILAARSNFNLNNFPSVGSHDGWGDWTALSSVGVFPIWSKKSNVGKATNALPRITASILERISSVASASQIVSEFLVHPLRGLLQSTVITILGNVAAYVLVLMSLLRQAALMIRHIDGGGSWNILLLALLTVGSQNNVAISNGLGVIASKLAAAQSATVICVVFLTYAFVSRVLESLMPSDGFPIKKGQLASLGEDMPKKLMAEAMKLNSEGLEKMTEGLKNVAEAVKMMADAMAMERMQNSAIKSDMEKEGLRYQNCKFSGRKEGFLNYVLAIILIAILVK